ncbi:PAS domain-containing protein [bacterium]|nr:PAS domain-containing protein [bacterium]
MKQILPNDLNLLKKCLIVTIGLSLILSISVLIIGQSAQKTGSENNVPISAGFLPFIIGTTVIILFSAIAAVILSFWIERPLKTFVSDAYEIGRGNFSVQFGEQRSVLLNKLAKLIHYMATEMERLGKVNVHGIVTEKNKTEALLRHIADGVIVTDMKLQLLVLNRVAENWFGLREKDLLSKPIANLIRNEKLIRIFQDVIQNKSETVTEIEYQIMDSATLHVLQAHASLVVDESNAPIGVIAVLRDVTREREADRIKTELVSMVAHELKSPLTSIFGFSELLTQMNPADQKFKEYAEVIMAESTRLTDFVNKFLDLSRLESGRTEVKLNPFDLKQVILRVLETHKAITVKKQIRVITDFPDPVPLAYGDQELIEQVIINLYSNAVKYSPKLAKVGVEIKSEGDQLLIHIIDNGFGIPKEDLPRIFDKFYRVSDDEHEDEIEGSGLGLALVKEIIERHGGTVRVQSRLNMGSVFSFTIPKYLE